MALTLSECPNLQGELLTLLVTSELDLATWRRFKCDAVRGCVPPSTELWLRVLSSRRQQRKESLSLPPLAFNSKIKHVTVSV